MREEFLHYLWRLSYFNHRDLKTTNGQLIEISDPGRHNRDAGPDFLGSEITLGGIKWAGNVEIHIHSSDWDRHGHQHDPAYNNVILHIVYRDDKVIQTHSGRKPATLELKGRIPAGVYQTYRQLHQNLDDIPCRADWDRVNAMTITSMKERMIAERLMRKAERLELILNQNNGDWEQTAFEWIARYFGMTVNLQPFEQLAKSIDIRWLARLQKQPMQVAALFFGQAGWLQTSFADSYPRQLKREYGILRKKFSLRPLDPAQWKFSRMRPTSFPTIRMAQLIQWCLEKKSLFQTVLSTRQREHFHRWMSVRPEKYWETHYRFDHKVEETSCRPGSGWIDRMIINAFSPILFLYGHTMNLKQYIERASDLWFAIPPENNKIIRRWNKYDIRADHAADSQALIHLYKNYCSEKRCLDCKMGHALLAHMPSRADEPDAYLYV